MRNLRKYLFAAVAVTLLGVAAGGALNYATDNQPPRFWATDGTVMRTVAASSDEGGPTREHPVYIEAQVERLYGLHIGTPVKVRYIIKAQTSVKVRFDTLTRGILSRWKSTWRLVEPPQLVSQEKANGFTTRTIDVVVAVWEPPVLPELAPGKAAPEPAVPDLAKPPETSLSPEFKAPSLGASPESAAAAQSAAATQGTAGADTTGGEATPAAPPGKAELWPFSVEFLISTDTMANGLAKWDYIETPPIKFGFASLVEPDAKELDMGPMGDIPDSLNRVGIGLVALGSAIILGGMTYLVVLFAGWLRARRLPAPLPVAVVAYRDAIAEAEQARHARSYLEQIRVAVRDYLGGATQPDTSLIGLWEGHALHEEIVEALSMLEQAVVHERLSGYEEQRIKRLIDQLIDARLKAQSAVTPSLWARTRTLPAKAWSKCRRAFKWRRA